MLVGAPRASDGCDRGLAARGVVIGKCEAVDGPSMCAISCGALVIGLGLPRQSAGGSPRVLESPLLPRESSARSRPLLFVVLG